MWVRGKTSTSTLLTELPEVAPFSAQRLRERKQHETNTGRKCTNLHDKVYQNDWMNSSKVAETVFPIPATHLNTYILEPTRLHGYTTIHHTVTPSRDNACAWVQTIRAYFLSNSLHSTKRKYTTLIWVYTSHTEADLVIFLRRGHSIQPSLEINVYI